MPISLTVLGVPYTQNFDTLASSGTSSSLPTGWEISESGTNANTTYTAGIGSSNTGDTYSFGSSSSTERALGGLQSGNLIPTFGASFTNNTGSTITTLDIAYIGEQWRKGSSSSDRLDFQYSLNATSLTTGTWTDVNTLDFTTPNPSASNNSATNGNDLGNQSSINASITGLSIANGATFWIRWQDFDASGTENGLAIDDFSLTPQTAGVTPPNLSINDVSLSEGNAGTKTFTFTVSLSAPAGPGGVTFDIATADNTATTANNDYVAKSLTGQTIPAGSSTYSFDVTVNGDTTIESNETFFVSITNVTGATVIDGQGLGIILNDDTPATPTVNLSVSNNSDSEASQTVITVTATATSAVSGDQSVTLTVTGTGITTGDYTLSNNTITIPSGSTTGSVTFTVVDDTLVEGTETAILTIANPTSGITLGGTTTQNITITDNDAPATPTVNLSVSANAGTEAGATVITVTATASSAVSGNQTVSLGVSGTGITASDFYLSNTTITIPNGQTTGSVSFIVADDAIPEGTETALLTISNPSAGISLGATTSQNITITNNDNSFLIKVGGITSANGAEIPAFDPGSDRLFVVAGTTVDIYTVSNTGSLATVGSLTPGITPPGGTELIPNSVAVKNGIVAVAYAIRETATGVQQAGRVGFFNAADGSFLNAVAVGALPDMLTFTPNGTKVLVANEGEPNSYGQANSVDPEGSVSIINLAGGVANATVQTATFTSFNSQLTTLRDAGVRIIGPNATVAQDLEPEYIAVVPDGLTARITLQENNAIAILDIASATITNILPLGAKNHNLSGNGFDASDRDVNGTSSGGGKVNIQNWPVFGLYQPDAIASFTVNSQAYYITANEGDARDYTGFSEEIRVGDTGYVLDPTVFPNAATLKQNANLGRLQLTNATGDTDGDLDFDRIEAFGARSFSIWDSNGNQVFDSGDQLEQITAAKTPTLFNSDGSATSFDTRSDNKGPEPEGVVVGVINNRTYAFIGLERTGDVMVYDVTNPAQPTFVQYINTPEDVAPEGLTFIAAADSPTGKPLLVVANEVSKTVAVFEVNVPTLISQIQGSGSVSPLAGQTVTIEGIVTADFQLSNQLRGFFIQEENSDQDGNVATSEGIFVFTGNTPPLDVQEGQIVRVTGAVSEFFNMTQITATTAGSITLVNAGNNLAQVTPTIIDLPATGDINTFYEQFEGMKVQFSDKLVVSEYFELARYGQIVLTEGSRPFQYTHIDNTPTPAEYTAFLDDLNRKRIILDDDDNTQNSPLTDGVNKIFYPQPGGLSTGTQGTNYFRGGDSITGLTGVLHWSFAGQSGTDAWRIRPTQANPVSFTAENTRPATAPNVGGNVKVASFNVLNYFSTIDTTGGNGSPRGADSTDEFNRQNEKLIAALQGIDADIFGLVEIENNGTAVQELVNRLNAVVGAGTYSYINTGVVGTDQITVAMIYKPAVVAPKGNFAALTDPGFTDPNNTGQQRSRPAIAQTFEVIDPGNPDFGGAFNVVVNHLKSKGADGASGADVDQNDGQGAWNDTRTKAANYLTNTWIPSDPTGQGDPDWLIIGDLNAYKGETPITALKNAGYTDLVEQFGGNNAYSYVFDGQLGYLDYALANNALLSQVAGVAEWHINADEVPVFDYNNTVDDGAGEASFEAKPSGNNLYEANAFRTSDHDPVIIGLDLIVNQAPTDIALSPSNIDENSPGASVVGIFSTTDPDTGNTFTYSLVTGTGNTDNSAFTIDGNQLKINQSPDFEVKPSYSIRVKTTDQGGLGYEEVFVVNINDLDEFDVSTPIDNDPALNTVPENAPNGTLVGLLAFAQDLDGTNNTVTYSLEDDAEGRFAINTASGVVSVADGTRLDFEAQDSHEIVVKATSSDGSSSFEAFEIAVLDRNDSIVGGNGNDVFFSGNQNDTILGLGGDDILVGGVGNDSLSGGSGNDLLYGEGGNDTLNGGTGNDYFYGGAGNDILYLGIDTSRDRIYYTAGDGQDRIFQFSRTSDQIIFSGIPNITVRAVSGSTQLRNFTSGQLLVTMEGVTGFSAADVGASKALTGAVFSFL